MQAILIGFLISSASAQSLDGLRHYSVITRGDFTTNSDVQGRTVVGGDLMGQNSFTLADMLGGIAAPTDLTAQVAGDVASGNPININAGSLEYGGSLNRPVNLNGGGSAIFSPGVDYSGIFDSLTSSSASISSIPANQTLAVPMGSPGPLVFTPTEQASGAAVFHVDGSDVFSNSNVQQIDLNFGFENTDVFINVSGTTINFNQGNFTGGFTSDLARSRVVWNFYEAETINFERGFSGQILAPYALLTTNSIIDGSVFASEINTTSEVHLPNYAGSDVPTFSAIPEPSSTFAVAMLLLSSVSLRRRK